MSAHKYISVFDLDHTLLSVNSSFRFGMYLFWRGRMSLIDLYSWFSGYLRHKYFNTPLEDLHQQVFRRLFKGKNIEEYRPLVEGFVTKKFSSILKAPIVDALERAKRAGHYTVVLSNSPIFVVGPIAKRLEVDEWEGTSYLIDDEGVLNAVDKTVDGSAKAAYVTDLSKKMGIPLSNVTAYTDSHVDQPMLEIVGNPIVVDPTKLLQEVAQQKGWQIIKT
ncbi:MAG: HAD family hydrolase [Chlamydiota bacterium]